MFRWKSAHESEFSHLKASLTSDNLILSHPNWNREFELHTDASKFGCGAMLAQYYKGELRPIRYVSRAFNPVESRWDTVHQELLAIKGFRSLSSLCSRPSHQSSNGQC